MNNMEKYSDLWSTTEANKFIFGKLKEMFIPQGFIVLPHKSKYLARIRGHHVQLLHQDIIYGKTRPSFIAVPTWTYGEGWLFCGHFYLRCSPKNNKNDSFKGFSYGELAINSETGKEYYKPDELMKAWNEAMVPQLQETVIDFFNELDFARFQVLCENGGDRKRFFNYGSSLSAPRFFSIAYNNLWNKDYRKAEEFLRKSCCKL